eukprot:TRINITY_DN1541_c0_g1_i1.p1 TRINITY_DN1541_c0_g1~~TRINITY_DN1541_c0_g1_i1.p1  ORF type:complete len:302 (-),score=94.25 TRINITY_DN1541_c0_g1_i1:24-929(-)
MNQSVYLPVAIPVHITPSRAKSILGGVIDHLVYDRCQCSVLVSSLRRETERYEGKLDRSQTKHVKFLRTLDNLHATFTTLIDPSDHCSSTTTSSSSSPSSSSSDVNNSLINLCMTIGAPTTAKEVFFIRVRNECCGSDRNDSGSGCDIVDDSDNADDEPNSMMVCSHVVMDLVSCESYNDTLESRLDPKRVYFLTRRRTELDSLPHFTPKTSLSLRGKKNRTLVYIDVVGGRERPVCVCSSDEEDDDIDVDDSDGDDDTIGDGDDDGSDDDDDVDVDAVMSDLEGEDGTAWFQFKEFLVGV